MSWASIANNQCISFNNLQDAVTTNVFVLKAAIPVSLEQITKTDADTYVYIDITYGPYAAKASNQLVVKSDLQPAPLLRTFRVLNNDTVNQIELDVQINSVQEISPTVIPANSVLTLTPQVDCTGFTSELLEYQIVSGYTPSSASFNNGSGTFTGTIAGGFITFTGIDLTSATNQDLTVNP